jgi:ribose/xylose/arabinose/galactoside ABC-type transport system permease subunit
MESSGIDIFQIIVNVFAVSGVSAWIAAFLTNKRGSNRALDALLDIIELVAGNIYKAKNAPDA